jgi:hypothetical protein
VLSGTVFCDGTITCPEEFYGMCGASECDIETAAIGRPCPIRLSNHRKKKETFKIIIKCARLRTLLQEVLVST